MQGTTHAWPPTACRGRSEPTSPSPWGVSAILDRVLTLCVLSVCLSNIICESQRKNADVLLADGSVGSGRVNLREVYVFPPRAHTLLPLVPLVGL